jgi:hypothetical protein
MLLDNLLCGGMREDGGTLRWNSTLEELNLGENDLGEVGGRTQTEALRLNATLTSLNLYLNDMGQGGGWLLAEALRWNSTLTDLRIFGNEPGVGRGTGAGLGTAPRCHAHIAQHFIWTDLGEGGWRSLTEANVAVLLLLLDSSPCFFSGFRT